MSKGGAPIVPVLKAEKGTISICGDFRMTYISHCIRMEDLLSTLAGSNVI